MDAVVASLPGSTRGYHSLTWLGFTWRISVERRGWYVDGYMVGARRNTQAAVEEVVRRVMTTLDAKRRAEERRVEETKRRQTEQEQRKAFEAKVTALREFAGKDASVAGHQNDDTVTVGVLSSFDWAYALAALEHCKAWLSDMSVAGVLLSYLRDPSDRVQLLILADALEDAGCTDAKVTSSLRKAGE